MKQIIFAIVLALLLVGCGETTAVPTPAPNPADIAMTMMAQRMDAEATQMAVGLQFTATAQVVGATATQEAQYLHATATQQARVDAQATADQTRRDGAATEQRRRDDAATEQARRDAEATAEQGRQNVIGTATAQMQATWVAATMQVLPMHDQWTQQAVAVEQALATNEVELNNLKVEQQRDTNTLEWLIPFLISIAMTALVSMYVIRRSRVREVRNDETGVVEALVLDNVQVLRPQLMPGPIMTLHGKTPAIPLLVDAETQNEVTRRAQAIEALRAMPAQAPTASATMMTNSVFGETRKPTIKVLDAGQGDAARTILDELSDQVVEEE